MTRPPHTRRPWFPVLFTVASFAVASLMVSPDAAAEVVLRPGAEGQLIIDDDALAGGGFASFVAGYNLELEPFLVLPELALGFGGFGGDAEGFSARALAGGRFGLALAVEPSVFLHLGYGHDTIGAGGFNVGANGFALRSGFGLDHRLGRDSSIGGHLVYDVLIASIAGNADAVHALGAGLNFAFRLP